tara:strand:+ start:1224 stop:1481 length:258 start_codon:yes stop_codon:yes gene_type:complete
MKQKFIKAFNALEKIGCPVIDDWDGDGGFAISAEDNGEICWADMYREFPAELDEFGVNHKINAILEKNGLFAEWINGGVVGVCQA